jgi:hypothetical protein
MFDLFHGMEYTWGTKDCWGKKARVVKGRVSFFPFLEQGMGQLSRLMFFLVAAVKILFPLAYLQENARDGTMVSLLIILRDLPSPSFLAQSYFVWEVLFFFFFFFFCSLQCSPYAFFCTHLCFIFYMPSIYPAISYAKLGGHDCPCSNVTHSSMR